MVARLATPTYRRITVHDEVSGREIRTLRSQYVSPLLPVVLGAELSTTKQTATRVSRAPGTKDDPNQQCIDGHWPSEWNRGCRA